MSYEKYKKYQLAQMMEQIENFLWFSKIDFMKDSEIVDLRYNLSILRERMLKEEDSV